MHVLDASAIVAHVTAEPVNDLLAKLLLDPFAISSVYGVNYRDLLFDLNYDNPPMMNARSPLLY